MGIWITTRPYFPTNYECDLALSVSLVGGNSITKSEGRWSKLSQAGQIWLGKATSRSLLNGCTSNELMPQAMAGSRL